MAKQIDNDAYGKGLISYLNGNKQGKFTVYSNKAQTERWPIDTFFRPYEAMSTIEHTALSQCRGRVLDVGAGAGSHSLWLQQQNVQTLSIDISEGAIETMSKRGVEHLLQTNFFHLSGQKFDTLLFLMNGIGIAETIDQLPLFFNQCKTLLNQGGRLLLDSSDILYLFEDEEGYASINLNDTYYGEMEYRMDFARYQGTPFKWLFIDQATLSDCAARNGFEMKVLCEDDHYQYLAELTLLQTTKI